MAAPKLVTKRCHFPEGLKGEQGPHVGELGDVVPEQIAIVAARLLVDMECHEAPERDGPANLDLDRRPASSDRRDLLEERVVDVRRADWYRSCDLSM